MRTFHGRLDWYQESVGYSLMVTYPCDQTFAVSNYGVVDENRIKIQAGLSESQTLFVNIGAYLRTCTYVRKVKESDS